MIRLLLLTVLTVISTKSAVAPDVTEVAVNEYAMPTGSLVLTLDALKDSITTDSDADETTTAKVGLVPSTSGSGTGAVITITGKGNGNGVATITVTCGGSGYKSGDTLTVLAAKLASSSNNLVITLEADDIATAPEYGSLKSITDALLTSIDTNSGGAETTTETKNLATTNTRTGAGAVIAITGTASNNGATTIRVTTCGSGYKPGDVLTISADDLVGSAITINIVADDIEGYVKSTPTTGYRTSEGAALSFGAGGALTGYYVALKKTTTHVQVVPKFSTAGALTATLGATTDTTLAAPVSTVAVPSSTFFPTGDGLNIMKLVSSVDGTYELNLMKPDDEVKHLVGASSKRSIAIAYNPASVGEFICSAFANDATPPTTRENVKSNGVAKSVRTHNIVPENMFSSLQMSLNGLEPNIEYDIYCHHLFHGIISNTANTVVTDKGSLTGVSLVPGAKTGDATAATLTLTFTHETSLASGVKILLTLYKNYDDKLGIVATGDCADQITTVTSGGQDIAGTHACAELTTTDVLELTINGVSNVASGTRGTEFILVLTDDDSKLNLPTNPASDSVVTFDLTVDGHGPLLQQYGWTAS